MFTDIVGYTALTQQKESAALQMLEEHRELLRPIFIKHRGREVKTIGDAFLVEFGSALEATLCAVDIQNSVRSMNLERGGNLQVRIGIHIGDVVRQGDDVLGDAVNICSRIYLLAEPGGVCISEQVYDQVKNKLELPLVSLGEKSLKNVAGGVEVYKVLGPWEEKVKGPEAGADRDRIAILPFRNMSPDPNDEFFAEGITEEVISTVSGISGLSVISRTSVMGYKGSTKKVKEIGKELDVGSVLEGSFRKAGNRIRVTTQLIDVAGDRHLWAQSYDRNMDDVFEVQSDIAKQVADALRVRILSRETERVEKRPTENTEAYTSYLKGVYLYGQRTGEQFVRAVREAVKCFELAVKEDPGFALGYVGISSCCLKFIEFGIETEANKERAKRTAAQALELDQGLAEAHSAIGWASMYNLDLRTAEEELRRAIELKPSDANAHNGYHFVLLFRHRWDEGLKHIERAVELDPLSPLLCGVHGQYYYDRRDYPRALELYKRAVELGGSSALSEVAFVYGKMHMFEDMKRDYAAWVELIRGSLPLAETYARIDMAYLEDDKETVRSLVPELEASFGKDQGILAMWVATYYFYLGENDKGFDWLERSYSRREANLPWISIHPGFDNIRTDPRYHDLLKRLGLD